MEGGIDGRLAIIVRVLLDFYGIYTIILEVKIKAPVVKACYFVASSRKDLAGFPEEVRGDVGHALHEAQCGLEPYSAKALKGFGGRGILEVVEDHDGNTYRAVYTVRFADAVYVLHCFQKKSTKGIATPQHEIELIKSRLRIAEADYLARRERSSKHD